MSRKAQKPVARAAVRPAARKVPSPKKASKPETSRRAAPAARPARAPAVSALFGPVADAESRELGHVKLDVGRAGKARVKRMIYPAGFRWSIDMKPVVGTDYCMHAHVGFLAHGEIHIEYADGAVVEYKAPHVVAIEPGHDGWVVGREPVVLIEFDFEGDTAERVGLTGVHRKKVRNLRARRRP